MPFGGKLNDETLVLHQVHPLKLTADVSASIVSNLLLWQRRPRAGLLVRFVLPVVGSALALSYGDLSELRSSPAGRYVVDHMPPSAMAGRLLGDALMGVGAWRRRPSVIALGLMVVGAGWSYGLLPKRC